MPLRARIEYAGSVALGTTQHAALAPFQIAQEISSEGDKTLLARSKSGNLVAIRVLTEAPIPEDVASTLSREASAGARLTHEAIVQSRMMLLESDFAGIVTEFVPGVVLQRLLRFSQGRAVRIPDPAAWYVVERVLSAVAHAHASKDATGTPAPVLHRELGPASIVIGWSGAVKVGEFGLTRMRALVAPLQKSTFVPDVAPLVAPEQARGEDPTTKSDVFAVALVALRLLSGRTPYARFRDKPTELTEAMSAAKLHRLTKLRADLPPEVLELFDRALDVEPGARPTADELLQATSKVVDVERGKEQLAKLVGRWRAELEKSVTPWERQGSIPDSAEVGPAPGEGADPAPPCALALSTKDDRPSSDSLWSQEKASEAALTATDVAASMSRIGSIAPEALQVALPPMRITMPSLPVYGGPVAYAPREKERVFKGPVAAALVVIVFVILGGIAFLLFHFLSGPPPAPPVGDLTPPSCPRAAG